MTKWHFWFVVSCLFSSSKVRTTLPCGWMYCPNLYRKKEREIKYRHLECILNLSSPTECHSVHVKLLSISTAVGVNLHLLHLPPQRTVLHPRGRRGVVTCLAVRWWQNLFLGFKPVTLSHWKKKQKNKNSSIKRRRPNIKLKTLDQTMDSIDLKEWIYWGRAQASWWIKVGHLSDIRKPQRPSL